MATSTGTARADGPLDPESVARADALFQAGTDALEAGDTATACPKLEAAVEITRGEALGGKLVLGRCYEASGRTASAYGLYREVEARARSAGQRERAESAGARAQALAAKVHHVEVVVGFSAPSDARVAINGKTIPRAAWGTPSPVDPGAVEITLDAPGFVTARKRIDVPREGGTTRVTFGERLVPVPVVATAGPSSSVAPTPSRPVDPEPASSWSAQHGVGLATILVGGASTVAGLVVGGVAISSYADGKKSGECSGSPPVCRDPEPLHDARTLGDVSTALFFAGLGVSAIGVVVFATAPDEATPVVVGVAPMGVTLQVSL